MNYPDMPRHKTRGTSLEAAIAMRTRAATLREAALRLLRDHPDGLTADECAELMGESVLTIRPRISELRATSEIIDSGRRRENASRRDAIVWIYPDVFR